MRIKKKKERKKEKEIASGPVGVEDPFSTK